MTQSEVQKRLDEIQAISLQNLEDDAVLALLAERKELLAKNALLQKEAEEKRDAEEKQKAEAERLAQETKAKEWEEKKQALLDQLAVLNKSITPDQPSEKLLALIQERKVVEAELEVFTATAHESKPTPVQPEAPAVQAKKEKEPVVPELAVVTETPPPEPEAVETEVKPQDLKITIDRSTAYNETSHISGSGKVSQVETSDQRIALDTSLESMEFQGYLSELKTNLNSLGTFLQNLPVEAKRNRAFMLQVAAVDPAYAMHYADKDTLKKDEAFNVAVAGMNNQRNTGNPLSEMLPEMRTGAVLLAGVKNDFRNVRFIRPEMAEYDEILTLAKRGTLEAAASLKEAHDLKSLIPAVLQKDKAFMAEVEKIVTQK